MLTENRQLEREAHIINHLKEKFDIRQIKDFSLNEKKAVLSKELEVSFLITLIKLPMPANLNAQT